MVTAPSCMASSSADCVLAGARLISSQRTSCANTGPGLKRNSPAAGWKTLVPVTSAGIRSGVNWMREKLPPSATESVRTSRVLATPGGPSSSTWPPAGAATRHSSTTASSPTGARAHSPRRRRPRSATRAASPEAWLVSAAGVVSTTARGPPLLEGRRVRGHQALELLELATELLELLAVARARRAQELDGAPQSGLSAEAAGERAERALDRLARRSAAAGIELDRKRVVEGEGGGRDGRAMHG